MGKEKDKMKFKMPVARSERMEELLEYLGDTSNYSKYYDGNRAEDFKKCFDIESEWCWKYADLMLRGMAKRELEYAEGHHVVPASFYGKRHCSKVDDCNLTVLTYGEHLWAHYCLVWCATGKMRVKMVRAFLTMYKIGIRKKRPLMPSEAELLDAIPKMELIRIQTMEPKWVKVEVEGRTHYYEDPVQFRKDFYEANKEKILEQHKAYYATNREKVSEWGKSYRDTNKEKIAERKKAYQDANREKIAEQKKARYEANKDKILERRKAYREANKEKIAESNKVYRESNREKLAERNKARREANKEKIAERSKTYYEANREKIIEQKKAYREAKKAAGYSCCKDPVTGKRKWVFVGLPKQQEAA